MLASHERRLDGAVPAGSLGIGETVEVRTRMGVPVVRGDVYAVTPFGVTLRVDGTQHEFYAEDFYLFLPEEPEAPTVAANMLTDMSEGAGLHPDARVRAKLHPVDEQDSPEAPANNATPVDDTADAPAEEPTPAEAGAVADDASSVDVNALPPDIKKAVVVVNKLDGDQMNYVLAQAGQSLMSALRRSNVSESELHGLVQRAQNAIYRILTGKPAKAWKRAASKGE